jgi:hypothetical protein
MWKKQKCSVMCLDTMQTYYFRALVPKGRACTEIVVKARKQTKTEFHIQIDFPGRMEMIRQTSEADGTNRDASELGLRSCTAITPLRMAMQESRAARGETQRRRRRGRLESHRDKRWKGLKYHKVMASDAAVCPDRHREYHPPFPAIKRVARGGCDAPSLDPLGRVPWAIFFKVF